MVEVTIQDLEGQTLTLTTEAGWTVKQLKEAFAAKVGDEAMASAKYTSSGKILKDDKPLSEYSLDAPLSVLAKFPGAPQAGGAGAGQSSMAKLARGFFDEMVTGLAPSAVNPDGSKDTEKLKAILMPDLFALMGGNWEPFNKTQEPVKKFINAHLDDSGREGFVRKMVSGAKTELVNRSGTGVGQELLQVVKERTKEGEEANALARAEELSIKHTTVFVNHFLDYEGIAFGASMRPLMVAAIGESMEGLSGFLKDGVKSSNEIISACVTQLTALLGSKVPDITPMLGMVAPVAQGVSTTWHQEYLQSKQ